MEFEQLLSSINPEIYANLKRAVELGKWPDGRVLTPEQRQMSLQAVIAYEAKHLPEDERSGYIPPRAKKTSCETPDPQEPTPLQWR